MGEKVRTPEPWVAHAPLTDRQASRGQAPTWRISTTPADASKYGSAAGERRAGQIEPQRLGNAGVPGLLGVRVVKVGEMPGRHDNNRALNLRPARRSSS